MKLFKTLVAVQGLYMLLTAVWPIVHITSFMAVTGYKTDVWLVKTIGALLIPMAIVIVMYAFIDIDKRPVLVLGGGSAIAFICIDFYYVLSNVIPNIYLADGIVQIIFLIIWFILSFRIDFRASSQQ